MHGRRNRSSSLVDVSEVRVLFVSHIRKRSCIVILHLNFSSRLRRRLRLIFQPILPSKAEPEQTEHGSLQNVGDEDASNSELELGGLLGLPEEWRGNVRDTGANPDDTGHEHSFRLASGVGGKNGESDDEGGLVGSGEVAAKGVRAEGASLVRKKRIWSAFMSIFSIQCIFFPFSQTHKQINLPT